MIWCCLLFFALQASSEGLRYIFGPTEQFDSLFRSKYKANLILIRTHAVFSVLAVCLGPLNFLDTSLRKRFHKTLGRLYASGVFVGSVTAFPMALMAEGGMSTRIAFFLQATFWILTLTWAVTMARTHRWTSHRRAMIRNYSLTYSAVVSRILLHGLQQFGITFAELYPVVSWTWVVGLMVGEWWIYYSTKLGQENQKLTTI